MEDQQASTMESEEAGSPGSDVKNQTSGLDAALEPEHTDPEGEEEAPPKQVDPETEGGEGEAERVDSEEGEDSDSDMIEVSFDESAPEAERSEEVERETPEDEPAAMAEPEEEVLAETQPSEAPLNGNDGQAPAITEDLATEMQAEAPEPRIAEPDDGRLWYVVHCYSGYENKVRHNLEQRIETMDMKGKIFDVVVPTEEEMEVRDGKRRTVERRVFPGYILVQMIMDEDSWYVVRNTPGVTGFVGMGNEPTPLRPEEVSQIVKRMEADAPRIKVTYDVGQKVRIIDGPFNDFIGTVDDIDMNKAKVRVMVSFFGRETPVELDFLQVEKA